MRFRALSAVALLATSLVTNGCSDASSPTSGADPVLALPSRLSDRSFASYTIDDLGTLGGGTYSAAYGINSSSHIVGYSNTSSGCCTAFLWKNGTMTDL